MNILLLTYGCSPEGGSEEKVGWQWVISLSKSVDEITVITKKGATNQKTIEKELKKSEINNVKFYFIDREQNKRLAFINKKIKRLSVELFIYQYLVYKKVKELVKIEKYDIIHQVTPVNVRTPGFCWKMNLPFIWGPINGANIPKGLKNYSLHNKIDYWEHLVVNSLFTKNIFFRAMVDKMSHIYCANPETKEILDNIIMGKTSLMSDTGVINSKFENEHDYRTKEVVEILWAGRLVKNKGLDLLFDSLKHLKASKRYIIRVIGSGTPEQKKYYENRIKNENLVDQVVIAGAVPFVEIQSYYDRADIFLFTSFREATGSVLIEAAESGLPIIMPNQNGSFMFKNSALVYDVSSVNAARNEITEKLRLLIEQDDLREQIGQKCFEEIIENQTFEIKADIASGIYEKIIIDDQ